MNFSCPSFHDFLETFYVPTNFGSICEIGKCKIATFGVRGLRPYTVSASCEGFTLQTQARDTPSVTFPLHTPYRDILCHRIHLSTNANTAQNTRNSARRFLSLCLWRCTVSFLLLPRSKTCLLRL